MYCYLDDKEQIQAFLFVDNDNIEMLFVHNDLRGKGVGKKLINYAIEKLNATKVDVNEENKQGIGFYKHMSFKVIDRSELDNAGRNYPILHMELEK
ncbi:GNAT family N-acetyltransferase [Tissierella sp. MSJ-40]|uniref:GNAT family N-acetyltransferase n=2 Tax=Tissierella simiarum TaxID=2841534 RepID=A0ABS6EB81_9FIRM|nr:GNAT family N-acetyltransferase [Tissierella simiarum]